MAQEEAVAQRAGELKAELAAIEAIEAKSIGWLPLCPSEPGAAEGGGGGRGAQACR